MELENIKELFVSGCCIEVLTPAHGEAVKEFMQEQRVELNGYSFCYNKADDICSGYTYAIKNNMVRGRGSYLGLPKIKLPNWDEENDCYITYNGKNTTGSGDVASISINKCAVSGNIKDLAPISSIPGNTTPLFNDDCQLVRNLVYCEGKSVVDISKVEKFRFDCNCIHFYAIDRCFCSWYFDADDQAEKVYQKLLKMYCTKIE